VADNAIPSERPRNRRVVLQPLDDKRLGNHGL
jgi:hypothetical protein